MGIWQALSPSHHVCILLALCINGSTTTPAALRTPKTIFCNSKRSLSLQSKKKTTVQLANMQHGFSEYGG